MKVLLLKYQPYLGMSSRGICYRARSTRILTHGHFLQHLRALGERVARMYAAMLTAGLWRAPIAVLSSQSTRVTVSYHENFLLTLQQ